MSRKLTGRVWVVLALLGCSAVLAVPSRYASEGTELASRGEYQDAGTIATEHSSETLESFLGRLSDMTGEEDPEEEEMMRSIMTDKARVVISDQAVLGLSEVKALLNGELDSFHPSTMPNVTLGSDLFASGEVLPISDTNGDGQITVDDLLGTFFHASNLESYFHNIEQQAQTPLAKGLKKQVIKHKTPALHHTIKKITSRRGWGIQDARFCQPLQELDDNSPFKNYTTFVKTLRDALMTPDST